MIAPPELMVVKYVGEVHGDWSSFQVFTTGQPGTYLFDQLDPWSCSTGLQIPVRAADLRPDVRRALRAGRCQVLTSWPPFRVAMFFVFAYVFVRIS